MLAVVGLSVEALARKLALPLACAAGMYASVWLMRVLFQKITSQPMLLLIEIAAGAAAYILLTLMLNRGILGEIRLMLRPSRG
jgi:hypothetical protein